MSYLNWTGALYVLGGSCLFVSMWFAMDAERPRIAAAFWVAATMMIATAVLLGGRP